MKIGKCSLCGGSHVVTLGGSVPSHCEFGATGFRSSALKMDPQFYCYTKSGSISPGLTYWKLIYKIKMPVSYCAVKQKTVMWVGVLTVT